MTSVGYGESGVPNETYSISLLTHVVVFAIITSMTASPPESVVYSSTHPDDRDPQLLAVLAWQVVDDLLRQTRRQNEHREPPAHTAESPRSSLRPNQ